VSSTGISLIDALAAEGRADVSTNEVRSRLGVSPQAASNLLARLARDGLVERVRRGVYLLHPLGELGVAAASADRLDEAIALVAADRQHRICFRTALHEHGLLTRSSQRIQIAVDRRLFVNELSGRPLESIIENPDTLSVGAEPYGSTTISTVERSLLESAHTPRRVGGITTVAEALAAAQPNLTSVAELVSALDFGRALRRLVSLDRQLGLGRLHGMQLPTAPSIPVRLDPTDGRTNGPLDHETAVQWPGPIDELLHVVKQ
jgi:predicted transcriptional regulator of viral defense system